MNEKYSGLVFLGFNAEEVLPQKRLEELAEKNIYPFSTPCGKESGKAIEKFLQDNPITRAVAIGFCGGISGNIEVGDVLIPSEAAHYNSIAFPDENLANAVLLETKEYIPRYAAKIETVDSTRIENCYFLDRIRKKGTDGVDMELFRFLAKCNKAKVEAAAAFIVSDILDGKIKDAIIVPEEASGKVPELAETCACILAD